MVVQLGVHNAVGEGLQRVACQTLFGLLIRQQVHPGVRVLWLQVRPLGRHQQGGHLGRFVFHPSTRHVSRSLVVFRQQVRRNIVVRSVARR